MFAKLKTVLRNIRTAVTNHSLELDTATTMKLSVLSLILAVAAIPAAAQEKFVPIPPDTAKLYHLNYARNFFPSPEAERADRKKVYALFDEVGKLKGKLT